MLLLSLIFTSGALAQRIVKGQVNNEEGKSIPFASITVTGKTKGTIADSGGKFSLSTMPDDAFLVISLQGYAPVKLSFEQHKLR